VIWPFQPNNPARVAVAECFARLAALVEIIAVTPAPDAQAVEDWHLRARRAQASVRDWRASSRSSACSDFFCRSRI
jgi:hypothetical protein